MVMRQSKSRLKEYDCSRGRVRSRARSTASVSRVSFGSTVMDAADCSQLLESLSSATQAQLKLGIFGKVVLKPEEHVLTGGNE